MDFDLKYLIKSDAKIISAAVGFCSKERIAG